jgi:hypothetical protein
MIYRVVTYDRTSERMKGSLVVPPSVLAKVKKIAGFKPEDDGLGEYPLDETQTKRVAKILGFRPEADKFYPRNPLFTDSLERHNDADCFRFRRCSFRYSGANGTNRASKYASSQSTWLSAPRISHRGTDRSSSR